MDFKYISHFNNYAVLPENVTNNTLYLNLRFNKNFDQAKELRNITSFQENNLPFSRNFFSKMDEAYYWNN